MGYIYNPDNPVAQKIRQISMCAFKQILFHLFPIYRYILHDLFIKGKDYNTVALDVYLNL